VKEETEDNSHPLLKICIWHVCWTVCEIMCNNVCEEERMRQWKAIWGNSKQRKGKKKKKKQRPENGSEQNSKYVDEDSGN